MKNQEKYKMSESGIELTASDYDMEIHEVKSIMNVAKDNHDMYVRLEDFVEQRRHKQQ